jgi:NAD(P)-dependent dehydrogenase (short-subunit alcohol dehydrogenase family)
MNIKGKVAIVTGASRGMGKPMALRLASHGAKMVIAARTLNETDSDLPGSLSQTAADIRALGADVTVVKCDLTVRTDVENLCNRTLEKHGRIDVVVNNARLFGKGYMDPFLDIDIDTWERHIYANFTSCVIISRLSIPSMIKNGSGIIVNMTSGAAIHEMPALPGKGSTSACYPATKAALNRFTGSLAKEMQPHRIPIIAVDPGATKTEYAVLEIPKYGIDTSRNQPMDVPAAAVEYLVCDCPDPMAYTGQVLVAKDLVDQHHLLQK